MDTRRYLWDWQFSDDFIEEIETFAIWSDWARSRNILVITKNNDVYAAGNLKKRHYTDNLSSTDLKKPAKLSMLCGKRIKKFVLGTRLVFICTEEGEVFGYGNYYDKKYASVSPQKVSALEGLCVVDIAIGSFNRHMALCDDGKIYKFEFTDESSKYLHLIDTSAVDAKPLNIVHMTVNCFMALLENGKVVKVVIGNKDFPYLFGTTATDEKDCDKVAVFDNCINHGKIEKLIDGGSQVYALGEDGRLFMIEKGYSRWPSEVSSVQFEPHSFFIEKIVDVAVDNVASLTAVLSENGKVYMWGVGRGENIQGQEPQLTPYESLHEVFFHYSMPLVTYKPIHVNELSVVTHHPQIRRIECITDSFKKAFEDPKYHDLSIMVEDEAIPVHKSVLAIRCEHFAELFEKEWPIEKPSVLEIESSNVTVCKAFLKYLYTDLFYYSLSFSDTIELLNLANKYNVKLLAERCVSSLQSNITFENATFLYERVIAMSKVTKMNDVFDQLEESCVKFCTDNFNEIGASNEFAKLTAEIAKQLIIQVCGRRLKNVNINN
ncbi:RCC1 and BTB domain-containing protein 1-like [Planococcus citri]|uniref:RCC1 and BTB domain-containing protein 1-like n=1 Tax=Planococcus citri TaxID=170843 RepID=UPI0031F76440